MTETIQKLEELVERADRILDDWARLLVLQEKLVNRTGRLFLEKAISEMVEEERARQARHRSKRTAGGFDLGHVA